AQVPGRSVLPAERLSDSRATTSGAGRGHPTARAPLRSTLRAADEPHDRYDQLGHDGAVDPLPMAGEYPPGRESHRACSDPHNRTRAPGAAGGPAGASRSRAGQWTRATTDAGRSRAGAHPGNGQGDEMGAVWTEWCGAAARHEPLDPAVSDEE